MWVFQIGTFSNGPLGNVLAKLQQWLVKSIEVNCSHCWGFRNQAVEAKIPGEIGQNYCRWFPPWTVKGVGVTIDEWEEIKAWFFFFFFLQWIRSLFLGRWKRNLWKDHQNQLGDSSQYWLQMLKHTMNILDSLLLNRQVPPRNFCMPSVTWEVEGVLRLLLVSTWWSTTEHFRFAFRKMNLAGFDWLWCYLRIEVIKKVFVIGILRVWLMSFPHTYCVFEKVLQVPCKMGNNNTSQNCVMLSSLL